LTRCYEKEEGKEIGLDVEVMRVGVQACIPFVFIFKKNEGKMKILVDIFAYIKKKTYLCNVIKKQT